MSKLMLFAGNHGEHDGTYLNVTEDMERDNPEYVTVGFHDPTGWPEDWYVVVEVNDEA